MSNELTLVANKQGELVDPNTSKMERLEDRFDEVETNLIDLADDSARAIKSLTELAIASQDPAYFEALAKLIAATSKANKDAGAVINAKKNLYKDLRTGDKPVIDDESAGSKTINNTLVMTSAELIDQILNKKG